MASLRKLVITGAVVVLAACNAETSDDPERTDTTISEGVTIGFGRALDRAREVAEQAEDRANEIERAVSFHQE